MCEYSEVINQANKIKSKNPNIQFLVQSDESEFFDEIFVEFSNSFYFKDEIRHMKKCDNTVDKTFNNSFKFSKYYLAITIIMSKCKYIICSSGNCSIWIMFYRGNSNNIIQYLNGN